MSTLPATAGVVLWIKSVALGAVLGGAVAVVTYGPRLKPSVVNRDGTAIQPAAKATGPQLSVPTARDAGVEDGGAVATAIVSVPNSVRSSVSALPSAETSQLSRETQLLEQARGLMGRDAQQALAWLDAHRREFPHGALELERELMSVDALLKVGRRQEAVRRAAQLRAQAPGSIYEQRLTRLLGEGPGQQR